MKLDSSISFQVLDRLKDSSDRLEETINQPGEDRCYQGDPLAHLTKAEGGEKAGLKPSPAFESGGGIEPEPVFQQSIEAGMLVEKLPDAPDESVSERAVPQQVEVSDQGQAVEDVEESTETAERAAENAEEKVADVPETEWVEEQLNPIHQQLSALQEASLQSQDLVDELHEQVGKLVVTSRRDLMRMKKRLDELEQSGTSQSVPDNTEQVNEIVSELQQQLETLGGRFDQFMGERGDSVKGMEGDVWLPRLNQLEEAMAHLEQRHDRLEQQQAALLDQQLTQLEERIVRLESSPERDQAVKGVSPTEDGRVSSIAEELRYEIAEVKKRSLRDIETINSKVGTLATSGDVQQIVRQAVALLENRIEGIEKQQKSTPMNSASIRF